MALCKTFGMYLLNMNYKIYLLFIFLYLFYYEIAKRTICDTFTSSLRTASSKATPVLVLKVILHLANTLLPSKNVPDNSNVCTLLFFGDSLPSKGCMPNKSIIESQAPATIEKEKEKK